MAECVQKELADTLDLDSQQASGVVYEAEYQTCDSSTCRDPLAGPIQCWCICCTMARPRASSIIFHFRSEFRGEHVIL
jgi:hypothetical protein